MSIQIARARKAAPARRLVEDRARSLRWCYRASVAIAMLLLVAAAGGLFFGAYRDNLWVRSQMRGQDFVSLFVGLPLLVISTVLAKRGSTRAHLAWLGALAYVTYSYGYVFGIAWNPLFLVYVVLLSLSAFTLTRALIATDAAALAARFGPETPTRSVSRFLTGFGLLLGALWGVQAIAATLTGGTPASVVESGHPTGVVFILDLGLVVPMFLLGGRMLARRRAWGFVLAGVLLVKGVAEGLALLGMALFMYLDGYPDIDAALIPLWGAVATVSAVLSMRFFGSMEQPGGEVS